MKKIMPLALVAILSLVFISCKKDSFVVPDVMPEPVLQSRIFPAVVEPRSVMLGDSSAVFGVGERVTIFVPYDHSGGGVSKAMLYIVDEAGEVVSSHDMLQYNDMNVADVSVPLQLQGSSFFYAMVNLSEEHLGKVLSVRSEVSSDRYAADDFISNAFSVQ